MIPRFINMLGHLVSLEMTFDPTATLRIHVLLQTSTSTSPCAGHKRARDDAGSGCGVASTNASIAAPLSKETEASGFALTDNGFDEPVGSMPWTGFLPQGRIRTEFVAATHAPGASSESWIHLLDIPASLALTRPLVKVLEPSIQKAWDDGVAKWFPSQSTPERRLGGQQTLACAQQNFLFLFKLWYHVRAR